MPQTYRETLTRIKTFKVFLPEVVDKVAENVRLRNILAHEYLDIRFRYLTEFLCSAESTYKRYIEAARQYVETGTP
ncbi:MAG TPA: hypothetical protein PLG79_03530 [Spirochaetales bacterium]|nr:hypothetical protein [Spirochaetales bacterium]